LEFKEDIYICLPQSQCPCFDGGREVPVGSRMKTGCLEWWVYGGFCEKSTWNRAILHNWFDFFKLCKIICNLRVLHIQGRNGVRWRSGQEASLAPPCSNLRYFGSKCTVLRKVLVTLSGLLGAPRS